MDGPYDWRAAKTHGLSVVIWYPAAANAVEEPQWIGSPGQPLLSAGSAAHDAPLLPGDQRLPLVLLSHGTGGSALNMAWLGTTLAAHGYIAVAVNHPGNNGYDGYTPQGFATWWQRARDLSIVTDRMLADSVFGLHIDTRRIGAAGFSLGGYAMIGIAGGITDPTAFFAFCKTPQADNICKSPPEFPQLFEQFAELRDKDTAFQQSLRHAGDSYRDPRIRAVFAIAPALGPAFTPASLDRISIPVEIVAGAADQNVPIASSARYFAAHVPGAKLTIFPGAVGHYVFLPTCTDRGRSVLPLLCIDAAGVDRSAIHLQTAGMALAFFVAHLN